MVEWSKVSQLQKTQYLRFTILYTLHKVWNVIYTSQKKKCLEPINPGC